MSKLRIKVGFRGKDRVIAGDMNVRNDLMMNQEVFTNIIRVTNPKSPLLFFGNIMGNMGDGGGDNAIFDVMTTGMSQEFLRVKEYMTGLMTPVRILDNSRVPEVIKAGEPFELRVDRLLDEDEKVMLRDQVHQLVVVSARGGIDATLTVQLSGLKGETVSKKLLGIGDPLNVGYGNSKGEGSTTGNYLFTGANQYNTFVNAMIITRYSTNETGSFMSTPDYFHVHCEDESDNMPKDFAINVTREWMYKTLGAIEQQLLFNRTNVDPQTYEIGRKSMHSRFQERPEYAGLYQQLDDIQEVLVHSLRGDTIEQGYHKVMHAIKYIKETTGEGGMLVAVCRGVGLEFMRQVLRYKASHSPVTVNRELNDDGYLDIGFKVKKLITDDGDLMIYNVDEGTIIKGSGREFDQITYNGVTSDVRSRDIYFMPMTKATRNGGKTKRAQIYCKEYDGPHGRMNRGLVIGHMKGITGQNNGFSAKDMLDMQETTFRNALMSMNNRIDSPTDGNEYHALFQMVPYIDVNGCLKLHLAA